MTVLLPNPYRVCEGHVIWIPAFSMIKAYCKPGNSSWIKKKKKHTDLPIELNSQNYWLGDLPFKSYNSKKKKKYILIQYIVDWVIFRFKACCVDLHKKYTFCIINQLTTQVIVNFHVLVVTKIVKLTE